MSYDPFDDLPDQIREAIREMMKKFQEIDPQELENMMEQVFGEDFVEKMREMQYSGGNFGFPLDPSMMKNFEGVMRNFMKETNASGAAPSEQQKVLVEEPYYELTPIVDGEGQLVVDLPGIIDVRQVSWSIDQDEFSLSASSEDAKYQLSFPVNPSLQFKDVFASVKNSVFILPYKSE